MFLCIGYAVITATSVCKFIFLPRLWSLTPLRGGKSSFQDRLNMFASRLKFESERNKSLSVIFSFNCFFFNGAVG